MFCCKYDTLSGSRMKAQRKGMAVHCTRNCLQIPCANVITCMTKGGGIKPHRNRMKTNPTMNYF